MVTIVGFVKPSLHFVCITEAAVNMSPSIRWRLSNVEFRVEMKFHEEAEHSTTFWLLQINVDVPNEYFFPADIFQCTPEVT